MLEPILLGEEVGGLGMKRPALVVEDGIRTCEENSTSLGPVGLPSWDLLYLSTERGSLTLDKEYSRFFKIDEVGFGGNVDSGVKLGCKFEFVEAAIPSDNKFNVALGSEKL